MNGCCLPVGISALACAIAEGLTADQLDVLGSLFNVLGDQLCLIAAQRALCENAPAPVSE